MSNKPLNYSTSVEPEFSVETLQSFLGPEVLVGGILSVTPLNSGRLLDPLLHHKLFRMAPEIRDM
jgi:hypothetical protein